MNNQEIQSKREDNWKKYPYLFNQGKNLAFQCQCGKKYVSFPGLYLHFQRKHSLKISTKINMDECIVINEGNKTTYKYMCELKRVKKDYQNCAETSSSEKENVSSVLSKFVQDSQKPLLSKLGLNSNLGFKQKLKAVVVNFQIFIFERLSQKSFSNNPQAILYQIPNMCNQFMLESKASRFPFEYKQTCQILLQMGHWLKKQGLSQLILELA